MPAPVNTSAATAIDLGSFPASVSQNVHDAGTTYTVWYKFTAVDDYVVGVWGFGDLTTYRPSLTVYLGPAGAPVEYLNLAAGENKPVQFPVETGEVYYLEFATNSGNPTPAVLAVEAERAPEDDDWPSGSILVNTLSAVDQFPAVIVSAEDGDDDHVYRFLNPFVNGENGDILKNQGEMLFEDILNDDLKLYNSSFEQLSSVAFAATSGFRIIRAHIGGQKWYVGRGGDGLIRTVLPNGQFGPDSWTITATQVTGGIAASVDESILYHANPAVNQPIKRYDLVNETALSDLAAAVPNYATKDIVVLEDDTILVTYRKTTVTQDAYVVRYSPAGATLNTYALGTVAQIRLQTALDSPTSFWIWIQTITPFGFSIFRNVNTSNGTTIAEVTHTQYEVGIYDPAANADPARFGNDSSCPFIVLRTSSSPVVYPDFEIRNIPRRWLRRSPIYSKENARVRYDLFHLDMEPGRGNTNEPGVEPTVYMRTSDDWGQTWSFVRSRSAGQRGQYNRQLQFWRCGVGRAKVFEVYGSDPCPVAIVNGYAKVEPGTD